MQRKTLLLSNSYEVLNFVEFKRSIKLLLNEKVEVLSAWDEVISFSGGEFKFPSVIRLKYHVKRPNKGVSFSRRAVFLRDNYTCQYCGKHNVNTIDHIIPRKIGGQDNWLNCVSSCNPCNQKKGHRSLSESGLKLIRTPVVPSYSSLQSPNPEGDANKWHSDWNFYIRK